MYDPFKKFPTTANWEAHTRRGSLGGHDYAMLVGTRLPALFAGTIRNIPNNGTAGHTIHLTRADGVIIRYLHLSKFGKSNGDKVKQGDIIGYSGGARGAYGSGSSTGPHLHLDALVNGVRRPYQDYLTRDETVTLTDEERQVGSNGAHLRVTPSREKPPHATMAPGEIVRPLGYVLGENVSGKQYGDIWLVIAENRYAWLGGFTRYSTTGLPNLTPAPTEPAPVEPAPTEPAPVEPAPVEPAPTESEPMPEEPQHFNPDFTPETIKTEAGKIAATLDPYLTPRVRGIIYAVGSSGAIILNSVATVVGGEVGNVLVSIGSALIGITGAIAISHRQKV